MTLPTSREAYADYYALWDRALVDPHGIRIRVRDYDTAIFHRHRLHKARSISKAESRQLYEPGDPKFDVSPYDRLMVTIRRNPETDYFYLILTPRTLGLIGEIESLAGTEFEAPWQSSEAPEPTPKFLQNTGMKLLEKKSDSSSDAPTDPSSSTPSTKPETEPTIPNFRRL